MSTVVNSHTITRLLLITACCILAVVCLFQNVEGDVGSCTSRCIKRCKTIKSKRQTPKWTCFRRCSRIYPHCETCKGPNDCTKCVSGYQQVYSSLCVDADECATNNGGCSALATCTNTIGSYKCSCNTGYTGDGKTCTDVDECATDNGGCDTIGGKCTNTIGSYTCACKTGYTGNGTTCTGWTIQAKSNGQYVDIGTAGTVTRATTRAATFLLVPCLAAPATFGCVSILAEYLPGAYLYPDGSYTVKFTTSTPSDNDAVSFYLHEGTFNNGFVAFESKSYPGYYFYVAAGGGFIVQAYASITTPAFKDRASYLLAPREV